MRLYKFNEFYCGKNYLDVQIYPEYVLPKKGKRKSKYKQTSEVQQALNNDNRDRYVCRLFNHNYTERDYYITLTYKDEYLPTSFEEAEREVNNYIRRIQYRAKREGLPTPKICKVTGYGERRKRLHHHLVVSGELPGYVLKDLWKIKDGKEYEYRGRIDVDPLEFDKFGIIKLANYFVKHINENKKRGIKCTYYRSRNLQEPKKNPRVRRLKNREVEDIAKYTDFSALKKLYPDYQLIYPEYYETEKEQKRAIYYNEHNGGYYFLLRFYKPQRRRNS